MAFIERREVATLLDNIDEDNDVDLLRAVRGDGQSSIPLPFSDYRGRRTDRREVDSYDECEFA
jgi:hypothetical protein